MCHNEQFLQILSQLRTLLHVLSFFIFIGTVCMILTFANYCMSNISVIIHYRFCFSLGIDPTCGILATTFNTLVYENCFSTVV